MPDIPSITAVVDFLNAFLPFRLSDSLIMFFIYSFIGWIVEVCYYGVTEGKFINRGFLGGPICPVYGLGFYGVIWFFRPFVNNFPILFFGSALIATTVELIAGVILYGIFHLRWWDYSEYKLNLYGFICVRFSIYWGVACSLGMYILHPAVSAFLALLSRPVKHVIVYTLGTLLIVDIVISICCIFEFNNRIKLIEKMAKQTHVVSDKLGSKVYDTVDTIITKTSPAVATTQHSVNEFKTLYIANRKEERDLQNLHRDEERMLSEKHREAERELLGRYVNLGKDSIVKTKDAAVDMVSEKISYLKAVDIDIIKRISISKNDLNNETLRFLKSHFDENYEAIKNEFRKG